MGRSWKPLLLGLEGRQEEVITPDHGRRTIWQECHPVRPVLPEVGPWRRWLSGAGWDQGGAPTRHAT